jgi:hypothetical protein
MCRRFAFVLLACVAISGIAGCATPEPAVSPVVAGQPEEPSASLGQSGTSTAPAPTVSPATAGASSTVPGCSQTREYTTTVTIGGEPQQAHGTACLQPDGSWRTVETTTAGGTQYTNTTVYHYRYPTYAYDPWWYGGPRVGGSAFFLFGGGGRHHHHGRHWRHGGRHWGGERHGHWRHGGGGGRRR